MTIAHYKAVNDKAIYDLRMTVYPTSAQKDINEVVRDYPHIISFQCF